jgi:hypothetical protein
VKCLSAPSRAAFDVVIDKSVLRLSKVSFLSSCNFVAVFLSFENRALGEGCFFTFSDFCFQHYLHSPAATKTRFLITDTTTGIYVVNIWYLMIDRFLKRSIDTDNEADDSATCPMTGPNSKTPL